MRTEFLFDDLFIQLQGLGRFLSSLRWRNPPDISSVTFDHDVLFKLPSLWGERVTYSVDTITAGQDHC
jgi:hypothetical protein